MLDLAHGIAKVMADRITPNVSSKVKDKNELHSLPYQTWTQNPFDLGLDQTTCFKMLSR